MFLVLSVSILQEFDTSRCVEHMSLHTCSSGQLESFLYIFYKSFCTQVEGSIMCIPYLQEKHFYERVYILCRGKRKEQPLPFNNPLLISRWQSRTSLSKLHALSHLLSPRLPTLIVTCWCLCHGSLHQHGCGGDTCIWAGVCV